MNQSQTIIYYFSGTGNSVNVARWFANETLMRNQPCSIVNIAELPPGEISFVAPDALLVFVSPVHGFNYPPIMLKFLRRFPPGSNRVALMNTRAGMKLGSLVTPGLSGITFYLAALLLRCRGYRVVGMKPVDLPSNWISVHPGLNDKTIRHLHMVNHRRVKDFAAAMLSGKRDFRCLREIVQDLLIAPFALLYYAIGRFFFAKTYYASNRCNGCGVCQAECPCGAIIFRDERPFWTLKCESCMHCMSTCPVQAVETAHGYGIGFLVVFFGPFLGFAYGYSPLAELKLAHGIWFFACENILAVVLLTLFYRLNHLLLKVPLFQWLMVRTSLTWYRFWGRRYRAIKNYDG